MKDLINSAKQIDYLDQVEDLGEKIIDKPEISDNYLEQLRKDILIHLEMLNLPSSNGDEIENISKESIRKSHAHQRKENYLRVKRSIGDRWPTLIKYFADGEEVTPEKIRPKLIQVKSTDWTGYLFRFATLLWSVPVSQGYGRRMRYLVMDRHNDKLIGLFAIGDPVFNLKARDDWIGWDVNDRRERLVNVMDAYVVGSVPPYSQLLGGKLVFSLIASKEVNQDFRRRYRKRKGLIDKRRKNPRLILITVTSALGRSSIYNRLKLYDANTPKKHDQPLLELVRIGETQGYGHFHLNEDIFNRLQKLLLVEDHKYALGYKYGQGPNWRIRVIRVGLKCLDLDENLIQHGIKREVYAMPLAEKFREFLCQDIGRLSVNRPSVYTISKAALERWIISRSIRNHEYKDFKKEQIFERIVPG